MIVQAPVVLPCQLGVSYLKRVFLYRRVKDVRDALVVVAGDLQLIVVALEALQVGDKSGLWACDQPVVNVAALGLVFEMIDGH
jgi:hypothetical protein